MILLDLSTLRSNQWKIGVQIAQIGKSARSAEKLAIRPAVGHTPHPP
jgi:hypothetical protein